MPTLGNRVVSMGSTIGGMAAFFIGFAALCYGVQYPVGCDHSVLPKPLHCDVGTDLLAYAGLLYVASSVPDLEPDDPNAEEVELPVVGEIYKSGLYFLLPIIVLVYFLMIEQKSPGLSAFWATMLLFVILLTQRPLKAIFRGQSDMANAFKEVLGLDPRPDRRRAQHDRYRPCDCNGWRDRRHGDVDRCWSSDGRSGRVLVRW